MKTETITVKVVKDRSKGYGYNLQHNQPNGFKGITGNTWAWYRFKIDAISRSIELMQCWNANTPVI